MIDRLKFPYEYIVSWKAPDDCKNAWITLISEFELWWCYAVALIRFRFCCVAFRCVVVYYYYNKFDSRGHEKCYIIYFCGNFKWQLILRPSAVCTEGSGTNHLRSVQRVRVMWVTVTHASRSNLRLLWWKNQFSFKFSFRQSRFTSSADFYSRNIVKTLFFSYNKYLDNIKFGTKGGDGKLEQHMKRSSREVSVPICD